MENRRMCNIMASSGKCVSYLQMQEFCTIVKLLGRKILTNFGYDVNFGEEDVMLFAEVTFFYLIWCTK